MLSSYPTRPLATNPIFFFQAEDGIRDPLVTGVQTCALPIFAFGGAGPLHACALAEELGMTTVLVPEAAGVLSALGLAASDERRDRVRSYVRSLDEVGELPGEGEAD